MAHVAPWCQLAQISPSTGQRQSCAHMQALGDERGPDLSPSFSPRPRVLWSGQLAQLNAVALVYAPSGMRVQKTELGLLRTEAQASPSPLIPIGLDAFYPLALPQSI